MAFWGDDGDTGERGYDYDEVMTDAQDHETQIVEATGDRDISVGIHNVDNVDYEVWASGGRLGDKTKYYGDFSEFRSDVMSLYPEFAPDLEDLGW